MSPVRQCTPVGSGGIGSAEVFHDVVYKISDYGASSPSLLAVFASERQMGPVMEVKLSCYWLCCQGLQEMPRN